jgi:hypothetical protein
MALSITHQYVSAIADGGDTSVVQPSDWNAAHTLSGLGTGVEDFLATPSSANLAAAVTGETGSGALVFGTAPTFVTSITTPIATITQGAITDPAPLLNMTSTWNDAADTFTAIKLDVTSTASAAASLLMDLQVGSVSQLSVTKAGVILLGAGSNTAPTLSFSGDTNTGIYSGLADQIRFTSAGSETIRMHSSGTSFFSHIVGSTTVRCGQVAIPAGGNADVAFLGTTTASFGIFFGSGAPSVSAAKGSLYLRSNGSGTGDRAYINTDGGTTWTAITTAG